MLVSTRQIPSEQGLELHPNPALDYIRVQLPSVGQLLLYEMAGRLWIQEKLLAGEHRISLSALPTGIFIYEFEGLDHIYRGKFIRQ